MITVYGISNCDTVKKARAWLDAHGVGHTFHDFKKLGVTASLLDAWADAAGWEILLNKRGTTFRGLGDADKAEIDRAKGLQLMEAHPSLIKRPVVANGAEVTVGFSDTMFAEKWG